MARTELRRANLAGVVHRSRSTVGTDTLRNLIKEARQDPSREVVLTGFLRGCGLPDSEIPWLRERQDGLTLYFSTKVTPLDLHIINGVIYGTVGFDRCEMVQFEQRNEGAVVRLLGDDPADLVLVAEVLHQWVWEHQEQAQRATVDALARQAHLTVRPYDLTATVDKIDRMELRAEPGTLTDDTIAKIAQQVVDILGPDAIEMLQDQGAKHLQDKDSKLMATWEQKSGRALGKTLLKKVTAGISKEIEGDVKEAMKVLADDGATG